MVTPGGLWRNDADAFPECETCSLSAKTSAALQFMAEHGIARLTVDGQDIRQV